MSPSPTTGYQPSAPAADVTATLQVTPNLPSLPQLSPSLSQVNLGGGGEGEAIQIISVPVLTSQDLEEELRLINAGNPQYVSQSQGEAGQSSIVSLSDPQLLAVSQPQTLSVSQPVVLSVDSTESLEDTSDSQVSGIQQAQLTRFVPNVQGLDHLSGGPSDFGDGGVSLPVFQGSTQGQPGQSQVVSVSDPQFQSVGQPQTLSVSEPQITVAEVSQTSVQSDYQDGSGTRFIDGGSSVVASVPVFQSTSQGQPGESQFVSVSDSQVQGVGEPVVLSVSQPQITQARLESNSLNSVDGIQQTFVQGNYQDGSGSDGGSSVAAGVPLFQSSTQGQPGESQFVSVSNPQVESVGEPSILSVSQPQITQARFEGNSLNAQVGFSGESSIVPGVPLSQVVSLSETGVQSVSEPQTHSVGSDFQGVSGGFIDGGSSLSVGVPLYQSSSQGQPGQSQFVSVSNPQVESIGQPQIRSISTSHSTGGSNTQDIVKASVEKFSQEIGDTHTNDFSSISHESGTAVLPGNLIGSHTPVAQHQSQATGNSQATSSFRFIGSPPVSSVILGDLVGSVTSLPGHQFDTSDEDLEHDSQELSSDTSHGSGPSIWPGNLVGSIKGIHGHNGRGHSNSETQFTGGSSGGFVSDVQPQVAISQSQLLESTFSSAPSQENIGISLLPKVNAPDMGSLPLADSSSPQFSSSSPSFPPFSGDLELVDDPAK